MRRWPGSWLKKTLSVIVVFSILGLIPGPASYEAAAQVIRGRTGGAASGAVPAIKVSLPGVQGLSAPQALSAGSLPNLEPSLPALNGSGAAPSIKVENAVPTLVVPAMAVPAVVPNAAPNPVASFGALKTGVSGLVEARDEEGKQAALDQVYEDADLLAGAEAAVSAVPSFSAQASAFQTSGRLASFSASPADAAAGVPAKSLLELEAIANDPSVSFQDRVSAVTAIAKAGGDEAKASLKSLGRADPEAGAQDYEVKRKALQALASLGEVVSLPPVSRQHADEILRSLRDDKPEAAAFDYDDTLERNQRQASPETGAALKAVTDAGVELMILTARSDRAEDMSGETVLDSLATLAPEQKKGLVIGASRGARVLVFDSKGSAQVVSKQDPWTESERKSILEASAVVKARYGQALVERAGEITDFSFTLFLPVGTSRSGVAAATSLLERELSWRGVRPAAISGRNSRNPSRPSFIVVSKYDKSLGIKLLASGRDHLVRLREIHQRLPERLRGLASKLSAKFPSVPVPGRKILMVGDHFFDSRVEDLNMTKAAPEGLALAVGGTADPRVERVFVWPSHGHAATQEIMAALAAKSDDGMDRKAIGGLFAQRTLSIIAFVLTSVAYPFIAIPVVGVAGYGALMALGPLAAIATGPLNGLIAQKLSARGAMALNTAVRGILAAAMPVLALFGLMNFWTLLLASIANGWVSSSVITTENIYIKRLSGKHLGTFNALAWINYVVIQVGLGLIVGIGSLVDKFNPMLPYWFSMALNGLVILPIIWKTIPSKLEPSQTAAPGGSAAAGSTLRSADSYILKHWKEGVLLAAGLGLYFVLGSTIPATIALLFWITRTGTFGKLWQDKSLRNTLLFMLAGAFLFFPLQYFGLPLMAETLVGKAGKAELLSNLLGALFFGQLISNTSQASLGRPRLPFLGLVNSQTLIRLGVLGLAAAWVVLRLFPGNWLAVGPVLAAAGLLMALSGRMTNKGWIKYLGAGFSFIALPLLFWGNIPVLFLSVLMMGLFFGPASVALSSHFYKNVPKESSERFIGVQSSLFNAAVSLGYGFFSLMAKAHTPAFPGMLLPMSLLFVAAGVLFLFAPRFLKGLPAKSLQDIEKTPSAAEGGWEQKPDRAEVHTMPRLSPGERVLQELRSLYLRLTGWSTLTPR
ncbi:MAG: hypothetical protein WC943_07745 [Elusimicrobiota bacterium]|jgi:hypothetical protein